MQISIFFFKMLSQLLYITYYMKMELLIYFMKLKMK